MVLSLRVTGTNLYFKNHYRMTCLERASEEELKAIVIFLMAGDKGLVWGCRSGVEKVSRLRVHRGKQIAWTC